MPWSASPFLARLAGRTAATRPRRVRSTAAAAVALVAAAIVTAPAATARAESPGRTGAAPTALTVGTITDPVDVENLTAPLLGWHVGAGMQSAYEVQVATTRGGVDDPDVWDSGQVTSTQNANVAYAGPALQPADGYYWRVRTWDAGGTPSDWSPVASFGTGPGGSWNGASAVWTSAGSGLAGDFTYTGTFNIAAVAASVTFRAKDTSNFYMWQFRATDGTSNGNTLKMHRTVGGNYAVLGQVPLPITVNTGTDYDFKIAAVGSSITTAIKPSNSSTWSTVNSITDTQWTSGGIGFRTGGTEKAYFDNLSLTDTTGSTLYANDFSTSTNTDFAGCGGITGGRLYVSTSKNCVYGAPVQNWAFLRGDVTLRDQPVAWAHLYVAAASTEPARQFVAKTSLNGTVVGVGPSRPVGGEIRYDGYDVTRLVNPGRTNTVSALAYTTADQRYEAQLVVRYGDGSTQTFGTGDGWKALNGAAVLPDGGSIGTSYYSAPKENFQAAKYPFGYDRPGFDDSSWAAATVKTAFTNLVATQAGKVQEKLETPASVVEYSPGNYFVDYGRTWIGGVSLDFTVPAPRTIDIRYGQVTSAPNTVKYATAAGNNYEDQWALRAGDNPLETWGPRVFRYVNVLNAPTGLGPDDFKADAYIYPFDTSASVLDSANSDLNKVWQFTKNSIEALNLNGFVDSYERERGFYEADDYIQMMSNLYTGGDSTLGTYSTLFLLNNRTWPTEWPFYVILSLHDTWMATGDSSTIRQYYAQLQGKLPEKWFDPATGFVHKTTGLNCSSQTDCDIVDWPAGDRDGFVFTPYNTVINAISYRAYRDMADVATALGRNADAATYTARADAIKAAVNRVMWNADLGAYSDGSTDGSTPVNHYAVQASAFATAMGIADPAQASAAAAYLGNRGMACSVYCADFMLQAAFVGGRADVGDGFLTSDGPQSWMGMIDQGAGATMEGWSPADKSNLTYSHPWSSSPASDIPQYLFGINPTTAGYDTFDVRPQVSDSVPWAHITVPSPKGTVGAAYDSVDGRTDVGVYVPANATARVFVPGAAPGTRALWVDGRRMVAQYDAATGYAEVDRVHPGCHVFSTVPGPAASQDERLTSVCPDGWTRPADTLSITGSASPVANRYGWNNSPVTVTFTCADSAVTVVACADPVTLSDEGAGQSVTGEAQNSDGVLADTTVGGIAIDHTDPVITDTGLTDRSVFTLGSAPATPTCTATDALSGLAGDCAVTVTGGLANGVGSFDWTTNATDKADNTATRKGSYEVVYGWSGFGAPVDGTAGTSRQAAAVRLGSTVPVKFQLTTADGTPVPAQDAPQWLTPVQEAAPGAVTELSASAATYRYDDTAAQYVRGWATTGLTAGWYRVGVRLDDGRTYEADVRLA